MSSTQPMVVVLAGPNGAGKTTAAPYLLRDTLGIDAFVNADTIAAGLSAYNPAEAAYLAGRIMLERMRELAGRRESFAFETTLASRSLRPWLEELKVDGYFTDIRYLWLPNADVAVERVKARVTAGGHSVPISVVRRRYQRSLRNLVAEYLPIAHVWSVYDSRGRQPRLVAAGGDAREVEILDSEIWSMIQR